MFNLWLTVVSLLMVHFFLIVNRFGRKKMRRTSQSRWQSTTWRKVEPFKRHQSHRKRRRRLHQTTTSSRTTRTTNSLSSILLRWRQKRPSLQSWRTCWGMVRSFYSQIDWGFVPSCCQLPHPAAYRSITSSNHFERVVEWCACVATQVVETFWDILILTDSGPLWKEHSKKHRGTTPVTPVQKKRFWHLL